MNTTGCAAARLGGRTAAIAAGALTLLMVLPAAASAQVTIAPASHDFGEVVVGAAGTQQFVLTNDTDSELENLQVQTSSSGPPGSGLAFAQVPPLPDTNCASVSSVPPDGTCTLDVAFVPGVAGEYDGTIDVTADGVPVGPTVMLSGTGIPPIEAPAAVDFGMQPLATIGAPRTLTVTLNGPQTVGVARVTGTNRDDFLITSDDCSGITVASDATCDLHLRFAPSAEGPRGGAGGATLVVPSGAAQATTVLSGTGGPLPQGPPGADGADGDDGSDGADGATGPQGGPGATGAQGPPGRDALVTCKVKGKRGKPKVKCAVSFPSAGARRVKLEFVRNGTVHARGATRSGGSVVLATRGKLADGRYTLRVTTIDAEGGRFLSESRLGVG